MGEVLDQMQIMLTQSQVELELGKIKSIFGLEVHQILPKIFNISEGAFLNLNFHLSDFFRINQGYECGQNY